MDDTGEVRYTEEETLAMLRLPRKECWFQVFVLIQT